MGSTLVYIRDQFGIHVQIFRDDLVCRPKQFNILAQYPLTEEEADTKAISELIVRYPLNTQEKLK